MQSTHYGKRIESEEFAANVDAKLGVAAQKKKKKGSEPASFDKTSSKQKLISRCETSDSS